MSSVNIAGSRLEAPYTSAEDRTTRRSRPGARWQAASSCIVPMTLCSFIDIRPPTWLAESATEVCTTVSTSSPAMTFAITGLRMSARTNRTLPRSERGGTTSTPTTRSTCGSAAIRRAKRPPRSLETPVTSTIRPTTTPAARGSGSLAETTTLDAGLLQQLAVLLLRHALATLLDDRTHVEPLETQSVSGDRPALPTGPGGPSLTGGVEGSESTTLGHETRGVEQLLHAPDSRPVLQRPSQPVWK